MTIISAYRKLAIHGTLFLTIAGADGLPAMRLPWPRGHMGAALEPAEWLACWLRDHAHGR